MRQLISKVFGGTDKPAHRSARTPRVRFDVERLERRDVPSNVPVLSNGILSMTAGDQGDNIHVKYDSRGTANALDDEIDVDWERGGALFVDHYSFKLYGASTSVQKVKEIHVDGGPGNDTITNDTALISVLRGGKGNDAIKGGGAADLVEGGLGYDTLDGRGGNDHLYANKMGGTASDVAADVLRGGTGDDFLFGGPGGVNFLYGGANDDVLLGGDKALANHLFGEDGDDYLGGGSAASWSGPSPFNYLTGGNGEDTLQGGWGAFNYFYAAETGTSGPGQQDIISLGQSKYSWWTVEKQDANGFWLPDEVVKNVTIDPPPVAPGPWTA
jgi:Ca2+-binding RTX toxin-like protein